MSRHSAIATGVSCGFLMLAGCVDGSGVGTQRPDASATAAAERPAATALADRDIEAPEVFQKSEAGLWDGRPSLGGVWVAHPDVTDPERVLIRNASNGQTIIGALFRRERNNPGPRFQVSSEAAAALGMIAGAPVELNVTALRRQEAPKPEPERAPAAAAQADGAEAEDPIAAAAAAIDAAEAPPDDVATATDAETGAETPKRRGFLGGLFAPRAAAEPLDAIGGAAAGAGTALGAEVAGAAATPVAAAPVAAAPVAAATARAGEPTPQTEPAAEAQAEAKPRGRFLGGLFAPKPSEPLSAVDATSPVATSGTVLGSDEVITATALPSPAAATAPARPQSSLALPYLQVATFTDEADAKDASARLRERGFVPMIYDDASAGANGWRVVVGPASTQSEQSRLLRQVRRLRLRRRSPRHTIRVHARCHDPILLLRPRRSLPAVPPRRDARRRGVRDPSGCGMGLRLHDRHGAAGQERATTGCRPRRCRS